MEIRTGKRFDLSNPLVNTLDQATRDSAFILVTRGRYKGGIGWCHGANFFGMAEIDLVNIEGAAPGIVMPIRYLRELPAFTFRKLIRELAGLASEQRQDLRKKKSYVLEIYEPEVDVPSPAAQKRISQKVRPIKPEKPVRWETSSKALGDIEDWMKPRRGFGLLEYLRTKIPLPLFH